MCVSLDLTLLEQTTTKKSTEYQDATPIGNEAWKGKRNECPIYEFFLIKIRPIVLLRSDDTESDFILQMSVRHLGN